MFLTSVLTMLKDAMEQTFDAEYPEPDFRNLKVSLSYPASEQDYPSIWCGFEPIGELQTAGVGHQEFSEASWSGRVRPLRRWTYQGYASYTIVALTNLERARLFDEIVKIMAFGDNASGPMGQFRRIVEDNEFIASNIDFDEIGMSGFAETVGTPWGTDEVIYEATITMEVIGEFISDPDAATLVPLSEIRVYDYSDAEPDPTLEPPPAADPAAWV